MAPDDLEKTGAENVLDVDLRADIQDQMASVKQRLLRKDVPGMKPRRSDIQGSHSKELIAFLNAILADPWFQENTLILTFTDHERISIIRRSDRKYWEEEGVSSATAHEPTECLPILIAQIGESLRREREATAEIHPEIADRILDFRRPQEPSDSDSQSRTPRLVKRKLDELRRELKKSSKPGSGGILPIEPSEANIAVLETILGDPWFQRKTLIYAPEEDRLPTRIGKKTDKKGWEQHEDNYTAHELAEYLPGAMAQMRLGLRDIETTVAGLPEGLVRSIGDLRGSKKATATRGVSFGRMRADLLTDIPRETESAVEEVLSRLDEFYPREDDSYPVAARLGQLYSMERENHATTGEALQDALALVEKELHPGEKQMKAILRITADYIVIVAGRVTHEPIEDLATSCEPLATEIPKARRRVRLAYPEEMGAEYPAPNTAEWETLQKIYQGTIDTDIHFRKIVEARSPEEIALVRRTFEYAVNDVFRNIVNVITLKGAEEMILGDTLEELASFYFFVLLETDEVDFTPTEAARIAIHEYFREKSQHRPEVVGHLSEMIAHFMTQSNPMNGATEGLMPDVSLTPQSLIDYIETELSRGYAVTEQPEDDIDDFSRIDIVADTLAFLEREGIGSDELKAALQLHSKKARDLRRRKQTPNIVTFSQAIFPLDPDSIRSIRNLNEDLTDPKQTIPQCLGVWGDFDKKRGDAAKRSENAREFKNYLEHLTSAIHNFAYKPKNPQAWLKNVESFAIAVSFLTPEALHSIPSQLFNNLAGQVQDRWAFESEPDSFSRIPQTEFRHRVFVDESLIVWNVIQSAHQAAGAPDRSVHNKEDREATYRELQAQPPGEFFGRAGHSFEELIRPFFDAADQWLTGESAAQDPPPPPPPDDEDPGEGDAPDGDDPPDDGDDSTDDEDDPPDDEPSKPKIPILAEFGPLADLAKRSFTVKGKRKRRGLTPADRKELALLQEIEAAQAACKTHASISMEGLRGDVQLAGKTSCGDIKRLFIHRDTEKVADPSNLSCQGFFHLQLRETKRSSLQPHQVNWQMNDSGVLIIQLGDTLIGQDSFEKPPLLYLELQKIISLSLKEYLVREERRAQQKARTERRAAGEPPPGARGLPEAGEAGTIHPRLAPGFTRETDAALTRVGGAIIPPDTTNFLHLTSLKRPITSEDLEPTAYPVTLYEAIEIPVEREDEKDEGEPLIFYQAITKRTRTASILNKIRSGKDKKKLKNKYHLQKQTGIIRRSGYRSRQEEEVLICRQRQPRIESQTIREAAIEAHRMEALQNEIDPTRRSLTLKINEALEDGQLVETPPPTTVRIDSCQIPRSTRDVDWDRNEFSIRTIFEILDQERETRGQIGRLGLTFDLGSEEDHRRTRTPIWIAETINVLVGEDRENAQAQTAYRIRVLLRDIDHHPIYMQGSYAPLAQAEQLFREAEAAQQGS